MEPELYKSPFGLVREMGYSQKEFFNLLQKALINYSFIIKDNIVTIDLETGSVLIKVGIERERRFTALVILPVLPVEFQFIETDEQSQSIFLKRFDASFMKGLG